MPDPSGRARIQSALRPFVEEALRQEEADLMRRVDRVTTGSGLVRVERLSGRLPDNLHGLVQDESVEVSFPSFSTAVDLETLLGQIIAGLGGAAFNVDDILTADGEVLVNADGNVLLSG